MSLAAAFAVLVGFFVNLRGGSSIEVLRAGYLALLAAAVMIAMIVLFYRKQQRGKIYIAVIHYTTDEAGDDIIRAFGKMKYFVKSKTMRKDKVEMAIEVFCKNNDTHFLEIIRDIDGVEDATLIQYNGEYHG